MLRPIQDRFDRLYRNLFWMIVSAVVVAIAALHFQSLSRSELRKSLPKLAKFGALLAVLWVLPKLFPDLRTRVRTWHAERPLIFFLLNFVSVVAGVYFAKLIFRWSMPKQDLVAVLLGAMSEAFLASYVFGEKPKEADDTSQGVGTIDNKPII